MVDHLIGQIERIYQLKIPAHLQDRLIEFAFREAEDDQLTRPAARTAGRPRSVPFPPPRDPVALAPSTTPETPPAPGARRTPPAPGATDMIVYGVANGYAFPELEA